MPMPSTMPVLAATNKPYPVKTVPRRRFILVFFERCGVAFRTEVNSLRSCAGQRNRFGRLGVLRNVGVLMLFDRRRGCWLTKQPHNEVVKNWREKDAEQRHAQHPGEHCDAECTAHLSAGADG